MLIPEAMSAHPSIFQLCRLLDEASIEADQTDLPKLLRGLQLRTCTWLPRC